MKFYDMAFFIFIWSGAMERERNNTDPDGSAEVWRSAERRRAEDIEAWLRQWFVQRRRLKVSDAEASYPKGRPALE
jgi:hypothetical protein